MIPSFRGRFRWACCCAAMSDVEVAGVINTLWGLSTYAKMPDADKKGFDDVIKVTLQVLG